MELHTSCLNSDYNHQTISSRILVLDTGSIVEYDSPKNLMNNKRSVFYGMALDAGLIASEVSIL